MFSSRTRWNRMQNRISALLTARRQGQAPLLDLTLSNPTRAGLGPPPEILAILGDPSGATYDPDPRGLLAAREAVARDYGRRGFPVTADRLVLTASTSEAYAYLFKLLCDPGDAVLIPRPSYPLFEFLATLDSVAAIPYLLAFDGAWHLDFGALDRAVTPRVRAVVIVNPNNPTGSYLARDEADRLLAWCASRDLAIISDEVFADFAFGANPARLMGFATDGEAPAFSLGGLSKSCGLPQMKLGWIAVSGPQALRDEALARLEIVADTYLSVSTPVQHAAPRILARLPELQAPIATRVAGNLDALQRRLGASSPASLLPVAGGWSAVLRIPATIPEEERVLGLLEHRGVLVQPGYFFDFPSEAHLVVSLLPEPEAFARGLEALLADLS